VLSKLSWVNVTSDFIVKLVASTFYPITLGGGDRHWEGGNTED